MRLILALLLLCGFCGAAAGQALQPGDTISITVYQDPKLDRQVVIGPTGMISFPLAGQIKAGGLTPDALENALKAKTEGQVHDGPRRDLRTLVASRESKPTLDKPIEEDLKPRIYVTGEVF